MFELRIKGERELYAAIDREIEAVSDWRVLPGGLQPHVDIYTDYEQRHLDSEGSGEWEPNTSEYEARKIKQVGPKPQMQFRGDTYRSLTDEGDGEFVREEGADFLRVGSSNPLALIHHEGRGTQTAKEIIAVTPEQVQDHWREFVGGHEAYARAGGFRVI